MKTYQWQGLKISKIKNWKKIEKTLDEQRVKASAWDMAPLMTHKCQYYVIIGERSNGKTYSPLLRALVKYFEYGEEIAIVRRYDEDFRGKRAQTLFKNHIENNVISMLSDGKWDSVVYYQSQWWFTKTTYHENKETGQQIRETIRSEKPFAYAFSLGAWEHDKSSAYPLVTTILFDEFLTRGYYLPDEFIIWLNVVSTIKRKRTNMEIFMCGNTINKSSPYFNEMGLNKVKNQQKGTIDIYSYGDTNLHVAVAFSDAPVRVKESDEYFAFDNPRLNMITGKSDAWEIGVYPHLPMKYKPKNIIYQYFIKYEGEILHCEIIHVYDEEHKCNVMFTYIHRKTTEIKDENKYLVYQTEFDTRWNYRRRITKPTNDTEKKILSFYTREKVFYQDNSVGEIVNNYIKWSQTASPLN